MISSAHCPPPPTENKSVSAEKRKAPNHLALNPANAHQLAFISSRSRFRNLWSLSLQRCHVDAALFVSLRDYAALGFLDLSFTNVDLVMLQQCLSQVKILHLHLFGCENISASSDWTLELQRPTFTSKPSVTITKNSEQRGFLIHSMRNVFALNGIMITNIDRRYWKEFFSDDGPGHASVISTKYSVSEQVFNRCPTKTIFSDDAMSLMGNTPSQFYQGIGEDLWRWKVLQRDFENSISNGTGILTWLLKDIGSTVEKEMEKNIAATLCLCGTFLDILPDNYLHQMFTHSTGCSDSPVLWSFTSRVGLMSLLLSKVDITGIGKGIPHSSPLSSTMVLITILKALLDLILQRHYLRLRQVGENGDYRTSPDFGRISLQELHALLTNCQENYKPFHFIALAPMMTFQLFLSMDYAELLNEESMTDLTTVFNNIVHLIRRYRQHSKEFDEMCTRSTFGVIASSNDANVKISEWKFILWNGLEQVLSSIEPDIVKFINKNS